MELKEFLDFITKNREGVVGLVTSQLSPEQLDLKNGQEQDAFLLGIHMGSRIIALLGETILEQPEMAEIIINNLDAFSRHLRSHLS